MISLLVKLLLLGALIFFGLAYFGYDLNLRAAWQTTKTCVDLCLEDGCDGKCFYQHEMLTPRQEK
ncbi:MAG TPA: hypothetical protein ENJ77_01130 [Candidatus Moranbacteria bacterium]|nr:hypothetical protein [Candidatus Moranbacteria bacterium]